MKIGCRKVQDDDVSQRTVRRLGLSHNVVHWERQDSMRDRPQFPPARPNYKSHKHFLHHSGNVWSSAVTGMSTTRRSFVSNAVDRIANGRT